MIHDHINANTVDIDSLKQLLKVAKSDDSKISLLNEIAHRYADMDPVTSIYFARSALEIAQKSNLIKRIGESYIILAYAMEASNIDSAILYYEKSLPYLDATNDNKLISQAHNNLGLIYKDKGLYQKALENFLTALAFVKNKEQLGMIYNNMGIVYRRSGSYDKSIEYFIKSLNIREEINDKNGLAITYGNLGNLYLNQKQYPQALDYYTKARALFNDLNKGIFEAHALQNMGIINTNIANYEEAVRHFNFALDIYLLNNHEIGSALIYTNKARIYTETENYDEAIVNNLNAIEILKKFNSKEYLTSVYIEIGKNYLDIKDFKNAYEYFSMGLNLSKEIGNKHKEAEGYEGMYMYHEELRNFPDALNYYKLYTQLKDSLFNEDVSKRMSAILSHAEIEKREKENDLLQERIRRKELENKGLVGSAIFLSLFAIYFFNTTQQKKRTNKLLLTQNDEINRKQQQIISINESLQSSQDQLFRLNEKLQKLNAGLETTVKERTSELQKSHAEFDIFLYQSSHALRRPIVNIMGLVQIARIEPEFATVPNIYDKIEDTAIRMDLMLRKLVMVSEINLTDHSIEPIDFEKILFDTITNMGPDLVYKKIEIRKSVQVEKCFKSDKRLVSIILQNLLENAINFHDNTDGRKSFVEILVKGRNEHVNIQVKDNGIGIPKELMGQVCDMFHVATTRSKGYGLGLYIVKKTVEKLKGKIRINSREHDYTRITVSIPNQDNN